jgi:protoporphyrin/coproporphyrin ferrochelatase
VSLRTDNYIGLNALSNGTKTFSHSSPQKIGVLITNLGTPDAPTSGALRRYLREFLADPRVIEYNRIVWWFILHFIILPFRPRRSAANYRQIWTPEGSPLLLISLEQKAKLRESLERKFPGKFEVALGMRYGAPSTEVGLCELLKKNVDRLVVIPLYPQYAAVTTGTTFDAVADCLKKVRSVPELYFANRYHDEPGYIDSLVNSVREVWDKNGRPEKLLFSYHGMPKRYILSGDPYFCHCHKTSRLVAEKLGLKKEEYLVCFQSLFGREEWLTPYTINTIGKIAREGVRKLDVICPGFSADCLETIEEIDVENRNAFLSAGGEQFRYIPALNAREDFISFLTSFVISHSERWLQSARESDSSVELRGKLAAEIGGIL